MINPERKEALLLSVKKLDAYQEIQNTMGRVVVAANYKQPKKVLRYFALTTADVSLEVADEGVFQGAENITAIVNEYLGTDPEPGEMLDMQLTTPIIEVADDCKTAKATWWCPGAGSIPQESDDPKAIWAWGQLAVDFIFIGEQWKIWHLHYFRYIKCDYEKGWVEDTSMINRLNTPVHPLSNPSTYHNPYSPLCVREGVPAAPRPYATFTKDDLHWELNRDKSR